MEIKKYKFHLSPLNPFIFEVMNNPPFESPLVPFYDMHHSLHLGYLFEGDIASEACTYNAGDCYLVPPWLPHHATHSNKGCTLGMVTLLPEIIAPCFFEDQDKFNRLLTLPPPEIGRIFSLPAVRRAAEKCFDTLQRETGSKAHCFAAIIEFFASVLEFAGELISADFSPAEYQKLLPVLNHIRTMERGALREYAAAGLCQMNVSSFSRLFSKVFRENFCAFELRSRLNRAAEELLEGSSSIKMIAEKWDFCDASHFGKSFKKQFDLAPGKFKELAGSRKK